MTEDTGTVDAGHLGVESAAHEVFLVIQTDDRCWVLALPDGTSVTFGRSRACTVHIDDHRVSRQHAQITRRGEEIVVTDLGSRNGTAVGGERITGARRVTGGEVVAVGPLAAVVAVASRARLPSGAPELMAAGVLGGRYIIADAGMAAVYEACRRVAATPLTVLVVGETGAGKENVAETIHRLSPRAQGPYLRVHLAALPESLLESELFGHERGAFTGADKRRLGYFESAAGGTLFLDEIGELPPSTQAKLLRVLETRRIVRLGASEEIEADTRIIAATNRDLAAEVRAGRFREDLYFRLGAFRIEVPPLRERRTEIPLLVSLFVGEMAARMSTPVPGLEAELLPALERYPWPGNVRELKHVMEAAFVLAAPDEIGIKHLPALFRSHPAAPPAPRSPAVEPLSLAERGAIVGALEACQGNQSRAARQLGISRRTLIYKMRKHDIRTIKGVR
jgi:two-component system, NtrC family, response regulator AtoC